MGGVDHDRAGLWLADFDLGFAVHLAALHVLAIDRDVGQSMTGNAIGFRVRRRLRQITRIVRRRSRRNQRVVSQIMNFGQSHLTGLHGSLVIVFAGMMSHLLTRINKSVTQTSGQGLPCPLVLVCRSMRCDGAKKTMKTRAAVAFEAGKPLEIVEVDLEGPRAGEVLVEMKATGLCHTDEFTKSGADPEGIFPAILRP